MSETPLVMDDLKKVRNCIWDAQVKWFDLGVELELNATSLEAIRKKCSNNPAECFSQMLIDWLAGQGSEPTWKNLSSALNARPVQLPALAKDIEANYIRPYIQTSQQSDVTLFPFLSKNMSEHVRTNYIYSLMRDTTKIKHSFIALELHLKEALKESGITAEKVINVFSQDDPRFCEVFKECDSIDKVFDKKGKHWSFIDYTLIELLIGCFFEEEEHKLNLEMKAYITKFNKYARRRVCECPSNMFGDKEENEKTLVFKIEECNFKTMTVNELKKLCSDLNLAIGKHHLRLLKTDLGCIQLTFRALPSAEEMIQKLTREEQQALRNMGVLNITYGEKSLNLVSLAGKITEHEDDEEAAKNSESDPSSPTLQPMTTALQVNSGDDDADSAFGMIRDVTGISVATSLTCDGSILTSGLGTDISDESKVRNMAEEKKPFQRLPTDVVPRNYKVELQPNLSTFIFKGKLEITAEVIKSTKQVKLNAAEIEIASASIGGQDAKWTLDKDAETLTLDVPNDLAVGETTLNIEYTGTHNDQMRGFYRSKYTAPNNPKEERYAAVTQFEAADARRALPCWDEPAHKASFDVVLIVPKDRVALSNMNVTKEEELPDNLKKLTFARSPVMSSYLLAFVVGEFDYVEGTDSNGVLVRVYTPVGKAEQGKFALDVAIKTLPFYRDYFDVAYPLPKMDLIAIPDFAAGAMENWGLVTYRERLLLVDPANSTAITKQLVALVVGHELAHQWFGNLVTMEWWTHLWLNEGFATWIEYLCVDHTHPEFEIWTNFLSREYASAQSLDALSNSHPIEVPVGSPAEVEEIFDTISYAKGSCVIRMLHDWIGTENFRTGLGNYLKKFAYKNASTEDLWDALEKTSNKPVAKVMSTWTKQMGYPVLSVEGKQEGENRVLTISQKKFCADGCMGDFGSMLWLVPVTIATKKNPEALRFILDKPTDTVTVEGVGPDDWILVNPGRQGFYRVSYSSDLFSPLLPALKDGTLSAQDRLGLQNDAFALARAGVGSTVDVLRLLAAFSKEESYTVWESLVSNLSTFARLFSYTDFYESFRKYALKMFQPSITRLGWDAKDTDGPLDVMLRSLVINQLGKYEHPETINEAKKKFNSHFSGGDSIHPDLKTAVFSICVANGDEATFNQLVELNDASDSDEEKSRIYRSLGCGKTELLTKKCLDLIFSDKVRPNNCYILLFSANNSCPLSRDMVWKFLMEKWTQLKERFQGQFLLARIIDVSTSGFVSEERATEIEKFFAENRWPMADRIVKQNCEAIRLNVKWLERDRQAAKEWLAAQ